MIVDFLVTVFLGILNAVLSLIPAFEFLSDGGGMDTQGSWEWSQRIGAILVMWDPFFPVPAVFWALLTVLATRLFVVLCHLVVWVWDKLPFKAS